MKRKAARFFTDSLTLAIGMIVIMPVVYGVLAAFRSADEFAAQPPAFFP